MAIDYFRSAAATAQAVNTGAESAESIVRAHLDRIGELNPRLNAVTELFVDRALVRARNLDAAVSRGAQQEGSRGLPLAGVPFAVKNLFDVKGYSTLAGSKINRELPPATRDAVTIERLEAAGAVLLGSLHMGEYAYDFTGENAHYGPCRNPWDNELMTGGSSSGSGAAVAASFVPFALGSDTNGSIRVPGSFNGVFGLKPTYGRLPRSGTYPFCDSLDHIGPLARTVADLALVYDAMAGFDAGDHACTNRPVEPVFSELSRGASGLRIAIAGGHFDTGSFDAAASAVAAVAGALGVSERIEIPEGEAARAAAFVITNVEAATLHRSRLLSRADDFDPDTRDRFLAGLLLPARWYVRAQAVRRWFETVMLRVFERVDVLIAPATPCVAPRIGQKMLTVRGREVRLRPNLGLFTQPLSCVGLPVVSVPVWSPRAALPIGVQVVAAPWREDLCLRVAAELEAVGAAGVKRWMDVEDAT